jgi:hypothetical protein
VICRSYLLSYQLLPKMNQSNNNNCSLHQTKLSRFYTIKITKIVLGSSCPIPAFQGSASTLIHSIIETQFICEVLQCQIHNIISEQREFKYLMIIIEN